MFIFLGWFLLSVQNNKFSKTFIPYILFNVEKFKKAPCTKILGAFVKVL